MQQAGCHQEGELESAQSYGQQARECYQLVQRQDEAKVLKEAGRVKSSNERIIKPEELASY